MSKIFADAQSLLDDENSIKDAASKSDDVKTVLSGTDSDPLIVKPTSKNKNLFECKCRTFSLLKGMCSHTLAVACVLGRVLDFCIEVKKKWIQSSKRRKTIPNLTAGIETGLPLTQRGMKKNEVSKAARRKRSENQRKMTFSLVPLSSLPLYNPSSLLVSQVHPSLVYHSLVISIWTIITRQLADIYHHPGPRKHLSRIHFILLILHHHSLSHQYSIQVIILGAHNLP